MTLDIEKIYSLTIYELYNMFTQTVYEYQLEQECKDEIEQVKNGVYLRFPIYYYTNKWFEEYPSSRTVNIKGHGKFQLTMFMKDKEARETIMRQVIINNVDDGSITTPRT